MRMRRKHNLEPRMEACADWWIRDPMEYRGKWRSLKPDATQLRVEVGCGKGGFTVKTAAAEPDVLLIAIEICSDAMVVGMEKAKEMLAYLVDKQGKSASRKEIATVLFESEDYSRATQNYLSKIIKELVSVLERVGADGILKRGLNSYSIDVDAIQCDLFEYEKDNATPDELNRFHGEYMKQYSWAEVTLARLHWKKQV